MNRRCRTFIASALIAHLLAIVAMAAGPQWHEMVHHDAGRGDHDCAVTLFASGSADAAGAPPVFAVAALECVEVLRMEQAREVFLARVEGRIRERAPPVSGV